jgi:hypothetical protein
MIPQVKKRDAEVLDWLDVLPTSQKQRCTRLMVEKLTLHSLVSAPVDIPAVSMPVVRYLKI